MSTVTHLIWGDLPNAGKPWSDDEDSHILELDAEGYSPDEMAEPLGRMPEEIAKRLDELKPRRLRAGLTDLSSS